MVNVDGSANVRLEFARAVVCVASSRAQNAPATVTSDDVAAAGVVGAASASVGERPVPRIRVKALVGIIAATLQWACSDPTLPPEQITAPAPLAAAGEQPALLPAFPGADGWGATALNECRSKPVEVLPVTNTDAEGRGSFDWALSQARDDRFTFIIFRTGGNIVAPANLGLRLNADCVYVAGQTAPGDGIAVEGHDIGFWLRGRGDNINDVVIRYVRFRGRPGQTRRNLVIVKGERIVLDHMSFSTADSDLLAIMRYTGSGWSAPVRDLSLQNSILSDATENHPTAFVLGGTPKNAPFIDLTNVSIQRNLLAHNSHRNPMTAADNALIVNNVIYNWRIGVGMMNRRGKVDWVNNYAKAGPMTRFRYSYVVNPYCNDEYAGHGFDIYAAGNIGPRSDDPDGDNWRGPTRQVACYNKSGGGPSRSAPTKWRRDVPQDWASAPFPVSLLTAHEAYDTVRDDVGANARLDCDGRFVLAVDAADARVLSDLQAGTGQPETMAARLSYGQGTPCQDRDVDGLPDVWEDRFFDCATCADAAAVGRDGYLVIEHYLNETAPS